jgi:hypothetical protein
MAAIRRLGVDRQLDHRIGLCRDQIHDIAARVGRAATVGAWRLP